MTVEEGKMALKRTRVSSQMSTNAAGVESTRRGAVFVPVRPLSRQPPALRMFFVFFSFPSCLRFKGWGIGRFLS